MAFWSPNSKPGSMSGTTSKPAGDRTCIELRSALDRDGGDTERARAKPCVRLSSASLTSDENASMGNESEHLGLRVLRGVCALSRRNEHSQLRSSLILLLFERSVRWNSLDFPEAQCCASDWVCGIKAGTGWGRAVGLEAQDLRDQRLTQ